ncbi:MAG: NfeD family protein [Betaproteobacteria bacterium]|nr:NfeD family protein [Betaproteobacteria bacterium]
MSLTIVWLAAGLMLIVAELLTGTFYLLVLGLACLAGAATAAITGSVLLQTIVMATVATAGITWVHRHRNLRQQPRMAPLDLGQTVRWEAWIDEGARLARVSYRDAAWEALIQGEGGGTPGEVLFITDIQGSRLTVSKRAP